MPYKDKERERISAKERKRRYCARLHREKFGSDVGDMRGKHSNHARSADHARWNEARIISDDGYTKVRVGTDHPLADPNGYAYEHLIVWVSAGRELPKADELLHHDNEHKGDNRLKNLKLIKRNDHAALHIATRKRDSAGRLLDGKEWSQYPDIRKEG